ncbi:MAG: DUF3800 domain-containing protein [Steroidobacteraceae bacterium]
MREVFVDESSQTGHAYMVLGAIVIPSDAAASAEARLTAVLERHRTLGEIKWTKVSQSKLHVYRDFVDVHFQLVRELDAEFHGLVVDCTRIDHSEYNDGDPELGFNKFLYTLLNTRVGNRFGDHEGIVVHLDARTAARQPSELQEFLNRAAAKRRRESTHSPFRRVAFRDSKNSRLLQLTDLLAGAIAWHKNDRDARDGASAVRTLFANEMAQKAGRHRFGADTPRGNYAVSVWNLRMSGTRRSR